MSTKQELEFKIVFENGVRMDITANREQIRTLSDKLWFDQKLNIIVDMDIDQPLKEILLNFQYANKKIINVNRDNVKKLLDACIFRGFSNMEINNGTGKYKFSGHGTKFNIDDLEIAKMVLCEPLKYQLVVDFDVVSSDDIIDISKSCKFEEIVIKGLDPRNYSKLQDSGIYFKDVVIQGNWQFPMDFIAKFISTLKDGTNVVIGFDKFYYDANLAQAALGKNLKVEAHAVESYYKDYFVPSSNWYIYEISTGNAYMHPTPNK